MKAPFPYFGGKSRISPLVWQHLGDVAHYIEPFCGSCAVLLNRPGYDPAKHMETVNDADGHIVNVWRALKYSPDVVAEWADWPVHHAELCARKKRINENTGRLLENLIKDDEWHDPKLAGYYIWAASCWIGSGLTSPNAIPHIGHAGKGVHGIGKRPHLSDAGNGVHGIGKRPHISHDGNGVSPCKSEQIYQWFFELSGRLRRVRVVNGDWKQVCGGNWQDSKGTCGIFFDPPYGHGIGKRDENLYAHDSLEVSSEVREWCLKRGKLKTYRIILAGYEGEHNELEKHGWSKTEWQANGGYANSQRKDDSKAKGKDNAKLERLWISPHCQNIERGLFE